ncbi:hypothetical protein B0H66DRAFT_533116 [Apodospora peruviana]|uniref:Uncharacterized protein n=1 Tax=Apodospora peruviana TaxID=516989 RepID=A0AAE0I5M0_9PEZI|nr:hypothetical protein B0H66DRAFT_533116 [Apodospora peruviana]
MAQEDTAKARHSWSVEINRRGSPPCPFRDHGSQTAKTSFSRFSCSFSLIWSAGVSSKPQTTLKEREERPRRSPDKANGQPDPVLQQQPGPYSWASDYGKIWRLYLTWGNGIAADSRYQAVSLDTLSSEGPPFITSVAVMDRCFACAIDPYQVLSFLIPHYPIYLLFADSVDTRWTGPLPFTTKTCTSSSKYSQLAPPAPLLPYMLTAAFHGNGPCGIASSTDAVRPDSGSIGSCLLISCVSLQITHES